MIESQTSTFRIGILQFFQNEITLKIPGFHPTLIFSIFV